MSAFQASSTALTQGKEVKKRINYLADVLAASCRVLEGDTCRVGNVEGNGSLD